MTPIYSKLEEIQTKLGFYIKRDKELSNILKEIENHLIPNGHIYLETGNDIDWYRKALEYIKANYKPKNK